MDEAAKSRQVISLSKDGPT